MPQLWLILNTEHQASGNVERQRQRQRTGRPSTIDTKTPPVCETLDEEEEAAAAKQHRPHQRSTLCPLRVARCTLPVASCQLACLPLSVARCPLHVARCLLQASRLLLQCLPDFQHCRCSSNNTPNGRNRLVSYLTKKTYFQYRNYYYQLTANRSFRLLLVLPLPWRCRRIL